MMPAANRKKALLALALAALLSAAWAVSLVKRAPGPLELTGPTMGTGYSVKIVTLPDSLDADTLHQAIDSELARINDLMSTYQDDSELSRFNQYQEDDWFTVSSDTLAVVQEAHDVAELTDGALDVTVGPLVNLWGFGPDGFNDQVPDPQLLASTLDRSGLSKLSLRESPPAIRKTRPDLYLDLSAVAKGYAVDQLAGLLIDQGIDDFLIEVGGEIRAGGLKAPESPWRIAVERPSDGSRGVQQVIEISNRGLATSGDYRNYFEWQGTRYSHVIDPRTGWPVPQTLASVSVVAETAMRADALATAMMVMGGKAALAFAEDNRIAALIIERTEDGFVEHASSSYGQYRPAGDLQP
jgi:thiamine biosynthesis lipoprotein